MKLLGIFIVGVCGFVFLLYDAKERRAQLLEYRGIHELLVHIEGRISDTGIELSRALGGFHSDAPSAAALADILISPGGEYSWRERLRELRINIAAEDKERLEAYLGGFGKCFISEERRKLSEIRQYFESREKELSASTERDIKVRWTLYATAVAALAFLVI